MTSFPGSEWSAPREDAAWINIERTEFYARPHEHLRELYRRFCG